MPENDPVQNAPHLAPRMTVPAGAYSPQPGRPERGAAFRIEEALGTGEPGAARHLLREAENGIGIWKDVSPWRLLEHLLDIGMIRPREAAGPAPDPAAAAPPAAAPSGGLTS